MNESSLGATLTISPYLLWSSCSLTARQPLNEAKTYGNLLAAK